MKLFVLFLVVMTSFHSPKSFGSSEDDYLILKEGESSEEWRYYLIITEQQKLVSSCQAESAKKMNERSKKDQLESIKQMGLTSFYQSNCMCSAKKSMQRRANAIQGILSKNPTWKSKKYFALKKKDGSLDTKKFPIYNIDMKNIETLCKKIKPMKEDDLLKAMDSKTFDQKTVCTIGYNINLKTCKKYECKSSDYEIVITGIEEGKCQTTAVEKGEKKSTTFCAITMDKLNEVSEYNDKLNNTSLKIKRTSDRIVQIQSSKDKDERKEELDILSKELKQAENSRDRLLADSKEKGISQYCDQ